MKRTTIKDIAEHLNISISTVSRAISNDKNIRKETKELVQNAAKELGYKPNPIATNLKFGRTNTIGVIVPEMTTPYASQVITGIQSILHKENIKVIIAESDESWEQELDNIATMENFMVDGIIVSTCDYKKCKDEYERLINSGMPVVFFDRIPFGVEASHVCVDDYIKSFFLVEHLIRSGRKKVLHIHGPKSIYNSHERARAYRDVITKFKLDLKKEDYIIYSGINFEDGANAIEKTINKGIDFDAVFAFTDTLAIGALNKLRELNINVPNDVMLASFSGTVLSTIVHPQITSVEPPLKEMGTTAAQLLVEKIKDPKSPIRSIVLDAKTVYRASTGTRG